MDHQTKQAYPVSSGNMIYLKIVTEFKIKSHLNISKRSSSSTSGAWHTVAVVSRELISRESSPRGLVLVFPVPFSPLLLLWKLRR